MPPLLVLYGGDKKASLRPLNACKRGLHEVVALACWAGVLDQS